MCHGDVCIFACEDGSEQASADVLSSLESHKRTAGQGVDLIEPAADIVAKNMALFIQRFLIFRQNFHIGL